MNAIIKVGKFLGGFFQKNSSTILTIVGSLATIGAVVTTVGATQKAMEVIEEDMTKTEIIRRTWKYFIPTGLLIGVSIGCNLTSNHLNLKKLATIGTLYTMSETAFTEYKKKVVETLGKNKEKKVRDDIDADKVKNTPPKDQHIVITGNGEQLCFDSFSGRYFESTVDKIRTVKNDLGFRLLSEMWISLNEYYIELGLPAIPLGDNIGWDVEKGPIDIEFSAQLTEGGRPCIVSSFRVDPRPYK